MKKFELKTVCMIGDKPADDFSDEELVEVLKSYETELVELEKIKNENKVVKRKVSDVKDSIEKLVSYMNSRGEAYDKS